MRLYKGYLIPDSNRKFRTQYVRPFKIIERVGRLVYKFKLPNAWKIHNIISIDYLEPTPFDVYARQLLPIRPVKSIDYPKRIINEKLLIGGKVRRYKLEYEGLGPKYTEWRIVK